MTTLLRSIRVNHWLKNLLVFIPVITSHQGGVLTSWVSSGIAFCSISLAASAGYLVNDLLDLKEDRNHPVKKLRPLATGALKRELGVLVALVLLIVAILVVFKFQRQNLALILLYFCSSFLYSSVLKKLILIDVLTLIGFYLFRIVIGAKSIHVEVSIWLYVFAFACFCSLALLKRHSELNDEYNGTRQAYALTDKKWIEIVGISSIFSVPMIIGLYIQLSPEARLYHHPAILLAIAPVVIFWLISGWRLSLKNELKEDLILFAFTQVSSYVCFGLVVLILGLAVW